MNWKDFWKEFCKKSWKKVILGTSDAWLTIRLSHRPSDPLYYIVNWRILILTISPSFCMKLIWISRNAWMQWVDNSNAIWPHLLLLWAKAVRKGTFYSEDVGEMVKMPFIWTFFCSWRRREIQINEWHW